jgi:hypothetical protein
MPEMKSFSSASDQQMDQLLQQSFGSNTVLSEDFEDRVMSSISVKHQKSRQGRLVLITMLVYWTLASLTGAWLWFDQVSPGISINNVKIFLPVLLLMGFGVIFLLRQTSLKLSDLFFATIQ